MALCNVLPGSAKDDVVNRGMANAILSAKLRKAAALGPCFPNRLDGFRRQFRLPVSLSIAFGAVSLAVLAICLAGVPPKIANTVVGGVGIGVVACLHAGRTGADKSLKNQMMDKSAAAVPEVVVQDDSKIPPVNRKSSQPVPMAVASGINATVRTDAVSGESFDQPELDAFLLWKRNANSLRLSHDVALVEAGVRLGQGQARW